VVSEEPIFLKSSKLISLICLLVNPFIIGIVSYSTLVTGLTIGFFGTSSVVTLFTDVIKFVPTDPIAVLTEDEVVTVIPVDTFELNGTREVLVFIFDVG
jgi:hypothetical protein